MNLLGLFLIFAVYLVSGFPALAPYRDAGEFAVDGFSLGVAHPPGYPFYVLWSRIIGMIIPWGNYVWRLNIGSMLVAVCSLFFLYGIIRRLSGKDSSLAEARWGYPVVFLLAFSYLFWCLAMVNEPYILNIFFVLAVIYFALGNEREQLLSFFVFGLGLTNRLDMVLVFPLLFLNRYWRDIRWSRSGLFFLILGLSLYLYLPLRARTGPWFNWNNPVSIERLLATITRRSYGHSLDLIAAGYRPGENFWPGIVFYLRQIFSATGYLGIIPLAIGLLDLVGNRRKVFFALSLSFLLTGPVFIYLANMPPNPHSLKILQDSFLLPNVFLFVFLGVGLLRLSQNYRFFTVGLLIFLSGINFYTGIKANFQRFNFSTFDYVKNIFHSCPRQAVLVQKKDVQLFSTWWFQVIQKNRPDIVSVAQGLSGSLWYQPMLKQRFPDIFLQRLTDPEAIENFIRSNSHRPVSFAVDTELELPRSDNFQWAGLLYRPIKEEFLFEEFYFWRNNFSDFFSQNLFTDYGRAFHNRGSQRLSRKEYGPAQTDFLLAYYFDNTLAVALSFRAYCYLAKNDLISAEKAYQQCIRSYLRVIQLAQNYKAFPDVINSFRKDLAAAFSNLGVVQERLGKLTEARKTYQDGLNIFPTAQLYFNLAVLYWKENDFLRVEENLRQALAIDPDYPQARFYYQLIRQKLRKE